MLNDWIAADLGVKPHDQVRMRYHLVGSHGELPEEERTFRVAGILKLEGTPAADPGLVPQVKGITDAKTIADWHQPFPMKLNLVTKRDEDYWDKYRATPKSFVSLETAQKLWGSRFGSLTSVRVAPKSGQTPEQAAAELQTEILKTLTPGQTRMEFQPVKYIGVSAAVGSNDFSQLFLGFSFFLILAAALLVGLIFRLGIERRGTSIGLLSAIGFTPGRLRRLFLEEGLGVGRPGRSVGDRGRRRIRGADDPGPQTVVESGRRHPVPLRLHRPLDAGDRIYLVGRGCRDWPSSGAFANSSCSARASCSSGATEPAITVAKQRRRSRRSLAIGVALLRGGCSDPGGRFDRSGLAGRGV